MEKRLAVAEENLPTYWATPKAPELIVRTLGYWAKTKVYVRSCACTRRPRVVQAYRSAYCGGHMYSVSAFIWGTSILLKYCFCLFFAALYQLYTALTCTMGSACIQS